MVKQWIEQLCAELQMPAPVFDETKTCVLSIQAQLNVFVRTLPVGFALQADLAPCPQQKREDLFTYFMRANFLGQGTGRSRIGLDANEKFLTLSSSFPYEIDYRAFREALEDFVNYVVYWREEITKLERESG